MQTWLFWSALQDGCLIWPAVCLKNFWQALSNTQQGAAVWPDAHQTKGPVSDVSRYVEEYRCAHVTMTVQSHMWAAGHGVVFLLCQPILILSQCRARLLPAMHIPCCAFKNDLQLHQWIARILPWTLPSI